jgi:hypothetical protein
MLRLQTWDKARAECQHYRRRTPEKTELYRIVYHGREELPRVWDERFQSKYGVLRDEVLKTFDEYLNCGLLEHGAARVYCDTCRYSFLVAYSCKKRGVCPSCLAKRAVKFAEHMYEHVLEDVPQRHIVFSIPVRLRAFMRYDRKLNDILFHAAWDTITECLGQDGRTAAAVLTLQCAGEALNFNPHLHGMLADGLFAEGGSFELFSVIDTKELTEHFCNLVLVELSKRDLLTDDVASQLLSQEHTGFSVWVGEPFQDSESERFVARYIERGPLSLEKLSITDDIVTYTTSDGKAHEFDALEFLALLSCQIPRPYESLTRYYGYYSCKARGKRKKQQAQTLNDELSTSETDAKPSSSWASCMKRIYELDPLECPKCKNKMRIISFMHDPHEINKFMDGAGIEKFHPPPVIPDYSSHDESLFPVFAPAVLRRGLT